MSRPPPTSAFRSAALLAFAVSCAAAAPAATPSEAAPTLQQRIDALLKHRLKPEALPVNPPNPFQLLSGSRREFATEDLGSKPAVTDEVAAPAPPVREGTPKELDGTSEAEVLVGCATRLKLGGIIILKDQIQIVVNGVARKEGDMIAADWQNTIVTFRIARLLPGHMVLRYGEAEATVKF